MDGGDQDPAGSHDAVQTAQLRQQLVDWAKGKVASWGAGAARHCNGGAFGSDEKFAEATFGPLDLHRLDRPQSRPRPCKSTTVIL